MVNTLRSQQHSYSRTGVRVVASLLAVTVWAAPAYALGPGAPPVITFAAVWINTLSTNAFVSAEGPPQLYADVQLRIPGGDVPLNVQSVNVTLPDGITQFNVPKNSNDLFVENEYFRNLTQAGVVGFPTGTYTFTVTDTAGGVTTVTDTLNSTTALGPPASVAVSGAVQVSQAPGEIFSLNLASNPTPTVTWPPVPGAAAYRLRVRPFPGPDVFAHTTSSATTSTTLPAGVMVPGRLYRLWLETESSVNGLPQSDARGRREVRVVTQGPELILSASGQPLAGQTVTFSARVINTGPPIMVDAQAWLGRPDGTIQQIASFENLPIANSAGQPNNDLFNGPFASMTFTGAEPSGNYVLGGRFTDPATGETIAQSSFRFQK